MYSIELMRRKAARIGMELHEKAFSDGCGKYQRRYAITQPGTDTSGWTAEDYGDFAGAMNFLADQYEIHNLKF